MNLYVVDTIGFGLLLLISLEPLVWWARAMHGSHRKRILLSALATQLAVVLVAALMLIYSIVRVLGRTEWLIEYGPWLRRTLGLAMLGIVIGHYWWRFSISSDGEEGIASKKPEDRTDTDRAHQQHMIDNDPSGVVAADQAAAAETEKL